MTDKSHTNDQPQKSDVSGEDPAIEWINSLIAEHTPAWCLFLAMLATYRGFGWLHSTIVPFAKKYSDLQIKTETTIKPAGKGFRAQTSTQHRRLKVFKRGVMIAEREFEPIIVTRR